ncbi:MAG TPA: toll/interleukin-1 receptor domain-containing protein [Acidobacteriota bacterium]|nr:toll/interleukin-1 receptor domain-containing protein [Acidobacteriota bacterium]
MARANCSNTVFARIDLAGVLGLDEIHHGGPSIVAVDTIVRSRGKIPETFLRGCGVPEVFIEYIPSLFAAMQPVQFYKCFISYTEADDAFSERLYNDLQAKGVRCWRWRDDAKWGRTLIAEIDQAIRVYDKLIVICSEKSLQSEPVIREIERALQKEAREHKDVLFPIAVDRAVFDWDHPLQPDMTRKFVGDFTTWKEPEKYRKAVERLIDALQAEAAADAATPP